VEEGVALPEPLDKVIRVKLSGVELPLQLLSLVKIMGRGAEALLYYARFLGYPAVLKWRPPKTYRHPRFDSYVRRERTLTEARAIYRARKLGIRAPALFFVDPDNAIIVMEYVEGVLYRDLIPRTEIDESCRIARVIGTYAAMLHQEGIAHGDLTTSNVLVKGDGDVYLIDFGLAVTSADDEDKGIDVHIFLRSLESTHYHLYEKLFDCFIKGYASIVGSSGAERVIAKVREIRLRGRYVEERRARKR